MRKIALAVIVASLALVFLSIPALYARNIVCDPTYDHFALTIPPALKDAPILSLGNEVIRYAPPARTISVTPGTVIRILLTCREQLQGITYVIGDATQILSAGRIANATLFIPPKYSTYYTVLLAAHPGPEMIHCDALSASPRPLPLTITVSSPSA